MTNQALVYQSTERNTKKAFTDLCRKCNLQKGALIYGRIVDFLLGAAFDDILSLAIEKLLLEILTLGAGVAASIQKRTVAVGKLLAAVAEAAVEQPVQVVASGSHLLSLKITAIE